MTAKEALEKLAKENVSRSIETITLCVWLIVVTLFFTYRDYKQEHRLNEQKRLLIALTNKVNEQSANKRN